MPPDETTAAAEAVPQEPAAATVTVTEPETATPETDAGDNRVSSPPTAGHIPMSDRLSLVSWGDGSAPSMPAVDDASSMGDDDDLASRDSSVLRSATTSLRSSVYDYVEENGRTYHRYKEGKYPLPNDPQEQARLDLQHAVFVLMAHGKSFLAPIDKPKRVLDFATGTGIWAIEFALQFPESEVIGTDLSPIQPDFIPANCRFEVDDAEDEWSLGKPFDYIHGRAILSCFRNPAAVIGSAIDSLAPGGYLELQDGVFPIKYASPLPPNCALKRWMDLVLQGAERVGRPWTNVPFYKTWMEERGLVNVVERRFYWPFNPWPRGTYYKTLGAYVLEDVLNGLEAISLKLLGALGMGFAEIHALIADVRRDLLDTRVHAYAEVLVVWGQKPGGAPSTEAAAGPDEPTGPAPVSS